MTMEFDPEKAAGSFLRLGFLLLPTVLTAWYYFSVYPDVLLDIERDPNWGGDYLENTTGICCPWSEWFLVVPAVVILVSYLVVIWMEISKPYFGIGPIIFSHLCNGFALIWFFSLLYHVHPQVAFSGGITSLTDALYFSIVTFTTLGYGDIQPVGPVRLICAIEALMGSIFLAVLVGLVFRSGAK